MKIHSKNSLLLRAGLSVLETFILNGFKSGNVPYAYFFTYEFQVIVTYDKKNKKCLEKS